MAGTYGFNGLQYSSIKSSIFFENASNCSKGLLDEETGPRLDGPPAGPPAPNWLLNWLLCPRYDILTTEIYAIVFYDIGGPVQ